MKVALVYDRINKFGGAERVLGVLHEMWPEAPVFTSVYVPAGAPWANGWDIRTSWLQNIPGAKNNHESFGWLMPLLFESLDLSGFDVIISLTSEAAKGVITHSGQLHVCYLLTPTRYLWSHGADYLGQLPRIVRPLAMAVQSGLRVWDYMAGQRPDYIFSISKLVQKRCLKHYRRESEVVYPPVMLEGEGKEGTEGSEGGRQYYLVVSRLVPYKRIDLAIGACNRLKENLVVVGSGTDEARLKAMAGPTVKFAGNLTDGELVEYYRGAKALLMPQEEDFGLTAVEALNCGTPVISYRNSGAAEVIDDGRTGILFGQQTVESLVGAINKFKTTGLPRPAKGGSRNDEVKFAKLAGEKFSLNRFEKELESKIESLWQKHQ